MGQPVFIISLSLHFHQVESRDDAEQIFCIFAAVRHQQRIDLLVIKLCFGFIDGRILLDEGKIIFVLVQQKDIARKRSADGNACLMRMLGQPVGDAVLRQQPNHFAVSVLDRKLGQIGIPDCFKDCGKRGCFLEEFHIIRLDVESGLRFQQLFVDRFYQIQGCLVDEHQIALVPVAQEIAQIPQYLEVIPFPFHIAVIPRGVLHQLIKVVVGFPAVGLVFLVEETFDIIEIIQECLIIAVQSLSPSL